MLLSISLFGYALRASLLKLSYALTDTLGGGEDNKTCCYDGRIDRIEGDDLEPGPRHRDHEQNGTGFTRPVGFYFYLAIEKMKHSDAAPYDGITEDDKSHEPQGDGPIDAPGKNGENEDRSENQEFVSDGVEECTQGSTLVVATGDDAISVIGEGRHRKNRDRPPVIGFHGVAALNACSIEDCENCKDRHQQGPEESQVGRRSHGGKTVES